MVDFDALLAAADKPKLDYVYRCDLCGEEHVTWCELSTYLLRIHQPYPPYCRGLLQFVETRPAEKSR